MLNKLLNINCNYFQKLIIMQEQKLPSSASGFSLLELTIAMSITLVGLLLGTSLLAGGFNVRNRENQRSDALADAQRAMNIMSRDIANSGFGLEKDGIVLADSGSTSIRVRANLDAYEGGVSFQTSERNEDVKYYVYTSGSTQVIARYDVNEKVVAPLANRIDTLKIRYYGAKVDYQTSNCDITSSGGEVPANIAGYVVITVCVQLPQVSQPGASGYQPASVVQLTSDVTLRNSSQTKLNEY
jgi:type II secretory pathway pseudopilin PulG